MNINEAIQKLQNEISDLKLRAKYKELPVDQDGQFYASNRYLFFNNKKQKKQQQKQKQISLSKAVFGI
ncbi:hypothetical protein pb186bvf_006626 [Paramecium bursaria]